MREQITTTTHGTIYFQGIHADYGFLSNFYPAPFTLEGRSWRTCEHYFQAQKFAGKPDEEAIRLAASPMVAARMGRSRQRPLRPDWETVKEEVMLTALRAKFTQHANLRAALLATGVAHIVERTRRDAYWGDGPTGQGRNRLGALLEQVRSEIAKLSEG